MDVRFGAAAIKCRAGLEKEADILINPDTNLLHLPVETHVGTSCLLVDECQFLEPRQIEELRCITTAWNVPVICYGLRTDFRTNLFPASKRLMELADNIEV
jgi:thymidine kinase